MLSIYIPGHWEYDSEQHIISTFPKLPSCNFIFQNFTLLTRDYLYQSVLDNTIISIYTNWISLSRANGQSWNLESHEMVRNWLHPIAHKSIKEVKWQGIRPCLNGRTPSQMLDGITKPSSFHCKAVLSARRRNSELRKCSDLSKSIRLILNRNTK